MKSIQTPALAVKMKCLSGQKNGGQRQSEEYALLWGHRVRLVFVDEVPYWLKARKYTEVSGAVTGVVEV